MPILLCKFFHIREHNINITFYYSFQILIHRSAHLYVFIGINNLKCILHNTHDNQITIIICT